MMHLKKRSIVMLCAWVCHGGVVAAQEAPFAPEGIEQTGVVNYKNQPDSVWKEKLKPEVYSICRQQKTEKAYSGTYDKFYQKGVYYCACCGGTFPVFRSETKYDSHTGWPSFWAPMHFKNIELRPVEQGFFSSLFGAPKTEVLCGRCGSHLGHMFNDGPKDHSGKRYCINSGALIFVSDESNPNPPFRTINR